MALEKTLRRINLLYMAILLMNFIILAKGQKNLRKAVIYGLRDFINSQFSIINYKLD